jgi:pantoate--beta-alanine ligase
MCVRVETAPIAREADGLAMSSRNAYLSPEERAEAPAIHQGLAEALDRWRAGERRPDRLLGAVRDRIAGQSLMELQYAEAVDPHSLDSVNAAETGTVLAVAAYCGTTRLIDNVELA